MKYLLSFILTILFLNSIAQQKQFSKGDDGKFIYYKVVDSQTVKKDVLKLRAVNFVNTFYKKQMKHLSVTDSTVLASGNFIIDKTILVVGHPSGEINYQFTFEARDGKYRYWLTDFVFIPYKRDRYGNFVASTTVGTPLEKNVGKLNAGEWSAIQESTYAKAVKFGDAFKKYMATDASVKPLVKAPDAVSIKKW